MGLNLLVISVICMPLLAGCVSSRISHVSAASKPPHKVSKVSTVAFAPGGGLLADAVGVELANGVLQSLIQWRRQMSSCGSI
jgi:hypothetical protein